MKEKAGGVTLMGNPLTLVGDQIMVGTATPDCTCLDVELKPVRLSEFAGKVRVLSSVPSLDTPVCDLQTRRFNAEAEKLGADVQIITISMDLPFAQKRWCGAAGVERLITLSDHRDAAFGQAYGVLIKELRLLARAVLVVDRQGVITYRELVHEVSHEPDYEAALTAIAAAL